MPIRFKSLPNSEKVQICNLIASRQSYLFLGSGVSDSRGANGEMRLASELRKHLVEKNDLPSSASLSQAYSFLTPDEVGDEITVPYTCIEVGQTIRRIAETPWKRVYTLNVDNCLENAFEGLARQKRNSR